jgi:yecA family protein
MHDDLSDEVGIFDFDEMANHLLEQGLETSPSQLHGCLSGLLTAGAEAAPEVGLDALAQALDMVAHGELASRLMQLYTVTAAALQDDEFTFHPLLPDDDAELAERTAAMADWCKGFLAGFAQLSVDAQSPASALSEDSGEVLRDIAAIAEAAVDDDESEEDLEESYMELVEYLRFAVLNVYMENLSQSSGQGSGTEPKRPLH